MAKKRDPFNRRKKLGDKLEKKSIDPRLDKNLLRKKPVIKKPIPEEPEPEEDNTSTSSGDTEDTSGTSGNNQNTGGTSQSSSGPSSSSSSSSSFNSGSMESFIGEIRMFGGNFAPRGWALCDGQLLPISQHSALFSILGTIYGGDGRTTFALPDLRGRVAVHPGHGPGLSDYRVGEKGGSEHTTLNSTQMPNHSHSHSHELKKTSDPDEFGSTHAFHEVKTNQAQDINLGNTGGNQSFDLRQPFLGVHYIICLQGIYPSRS